MDSATATASMPPAPPSAWPVTPLMDVTGGPGAPNTLVDGLGLGQVVERRRGPVGVDVADVAGRDAGVGQGQLHAGRRPVAARGGGGDVIGVGRRAGAEELAVDARPAPPGVLEVLEHQRAGALGAHEPVAPDVEGARHAHWTTAPSCWRTRPGPPASWRPQTHRRWPRRTGRVATSRAAAATAWVPAAQAVVTVSHGPFHPARMEIEAAPALGISMGMRKGDTRRAPSPSTPGSAPRATRGRRCRWRRSPRHGRGRRRCRRRRSSAMSAAATENWVKRSSAPDLFGPEPHGGVEVEHAPFALGRGRQQAVPEGVDADAATRHHAESGDGDAPPGNRPVGPDAQQHQSLAAMRS